MTGSEVIEEIKRLPARERTKVLEFAREQLPDRQLSLEELEVIVDRMLEAKDPAEADRWQQELVRGYYGGQPHA